jgi:hypothetical protein
VRAPCGAPTTAAHVPAALHASHWPSHAALQHTPSTQNVELHSTLPAHVWPFGLSGTQVPAAQRLLAAQSDGTVHELAQAVAPQMNGVQLCVCTAGHAAALPVQAPRNVAVPTAQEAARHWVPASTNRSTGHAAAAPLQLSATSHTPPAARQPTEDGRKPSTGHADEMPSHDSLTSHTPASGRHTTVAGSGEQVPSTGPFAATLHAWQSVVPPLHAVLQHTPSTQRALSHSAAVVHGAPSPPTSR